MSRSAMAGERTRSEHAQIIASDGVDADRIQCERHLRAGSESASEKFEFGVDYNYVRANGPPGGCGCFSMNGGNAWAGYRLTTDSAPWANSARNTLGTSTGQEKISRLFSYLFGPRFTLRKSDRWQPFGEVLLGGAHATGTFEPSFSGGSGSFNSFSLVAGGGLDIHIMRHIDIRAIDADYYLTRFPNGVNGRQNNLRISAGVVFRF